MEQKADIKIREMEKEQSKLAHLMGIAGIGKQRRTKGGWW